MKTPADYITEYLEHSGLTAKDIACAVKMKTSAIERVIALRRDLAPAESTRIAKIIGVPVHKLMHKKIETDAIPKFNWNVSVDKSAEREAIRKTIAKWVEQKLHKPRYSPVKRKILEGRYIDGKTLSAIGKDVGLSRERVRQVCADYDNSRRRAR